MNPTRTEPWFNPLLWLEYQAANKPHKGGQGPRPKRANGTAFTIIEPNLNSLRLSYRQDKP